MISNGFQAVRQGDLGAVGILKCTVPDRNQAVSQLYRFCIFKSEKSQCHVQLCHRVGNCNVLDTNKRCLHCINLRHQLCEHCVLFLAAHCRRVIAICLQQFRQFVCCRIQPCMIFFPRINTLFYGAGIPLYRNLHTVRRCRFPCAMHRIPVNCPCHGISQCAGSFLCGNRQPCRSGQHCQCRQKCSHFLARFHTITLSCKSLHRAVYASFLVFT